MVKFPAGVVWLSKIEMWWFIHKLDAPGSSYLEESARIYNIALKLESISNIVCGRNECPLPSHFVPCFIRLTMLCYMNRIKYIAQAHHPLNRNYHPTFKVFLLVQLHPCEHETSWAALHQWILVALEGLCPFADFAILNGWVWWMYTSYFRSVVILDAIPSLFKIKSKQFLGWWSHLGNAE